MPEVDEQSVLPDGDAQGEGHGQAEGLCVVAARVDGVRHLVQQRHHEVVLQGTQARHAAVWPGLLALLCLRINLCSQLFVTFGESLPGEPETTSGTHPRLRQTGLDELPVTHRQQHHPLFWSLVSPT